MYTVPRTSRNEGLANTYSTPDSGVYISGVTIVHRRHRDDHKTIATIVWQKWLRSTQDSRLLAAFQTAVTYTIIFHFLQASNYTITLKTFAREQYFQLF